MLPDDKNAAVGKGGGTAGGTVAYAIDRDEPLRSTRWRPADGQGRKRGKGEV